MNKLFLVCILLGCMALGCGKSGPVMYPVNGTVSFKDAALTEGTITFEDSSTGFADAFDIQPDGTYSANMPEGSYMVSIQPPMVAVADTADSEGGDEFKRVPNIPNRYWSSYESGLTVSVNQATTFDVNMVDSAQRR